MMGDMTTVLRSQRHVDASRPRSLPKDSTTSARKVGNLVSQMPSLRSPSHHGALAKDYRRFV